MQAYGKIVDIEKNQGRRVMQVQIDKDVAAVVKKKGVQDVWMRFDDGRTITAKQRKMIYATFNDISNYTGYLPEETKQHMKFYHIQKTGCEYFSLSDCSVDQARVFINTLIEFCLDYGVELSDNILNRTDDIGAYLYQCLRHRKCAVCGKAAEIHHVDTIGMGNDRRVYDDSDNRKIALCRLHHTIAHQKGVYAFERDYHVYGILYEEGEAS